MIVNTVHNGDKYYSNNKINNNNNNDNSDKDLDIMVSLLQFWRPFNGHSGFLCPAGWYFITVHTTNIFYFFIFVVAVVSKTYILMNSDCTVYVCKMCFTFYVRTMTIYVHKNQYQKKELNEVVLHLGALNF